MDFSIGKPVEHLLRIIVTSFLMQVFQFYPQAFEQGNIVELAQ